VPDAQHSGQGAPDLESGARSPEVQAGGLNSGLIQTHGRDCTDADRQRSLFLLAEDLGGQVAADRIQDDRQGHHQG
jgi:hypothetical protein